MAPGGPRGARGDGRRPAGPGAPELPVRGATHAVAGRGDAGAPARSGSNGRADRRLTSTPTRPIGWPDWSPARAARSWSAAGPCSSPGSTTSGRRCWAGRSSPNPSRAPVDRSACLAAGQALIGGAWAAAHRPEVVIQFGAAPTSRATQAFVASAEQARRRGSLAPRSRSRSSGVVATRGRSRGAAGGMLGRHPLMQRGIGIALTGAHTRDEIEELWRGRIDPAPDEWRDGVARRRSSSLGARWTTSMDGWDEPFEPRIARDVAAWAPGRGVPVRRELDARSRPRSRDGAARRPPGPGQPRGERDRRARVDGARRRGRPTAVRRWRSLGDLSFLHDVGAVLWNAPRVFDLTIVVVNNGGGQVFSLLPQRDLPEHRELFVTPHAVDIGGTVRGRRRRPRAGRTGVGPVARAGPGGRRRRPQRGGGHRGCGARPPAPARDARMPSTRRWRERERTAAVDRVRHDR